MALKLPVFTVTSDDNFSMTQQERLFELLKFDIIIKGLSSDFEPNIESTLRAELAVLYNNTTTSSRPPPMTSHHDHMTNRQQIDENLKNRLKALKSSTATDFTIVVGGQDIKCHKVVLIAMCPYFEALFRTGLTESLTDRVEIESLEFRVVQQLVDYFYSGNMKLEYSNVKQLIEACDYLQLNVLRAKCEVWVTQNLKPSNCLGWYSLSKIFGMKDLTEKAYTMMCNQFTEVSDSDEFEQLSLQEVLQYIGSPYLLLRNEDAVLNSCIDWILCDTESRSPAFEELLTRVKLQYCTPVFLNHVIEHHKDLLNMDIMHQMFSAAFLSISSTSLVKNNSLFMYKERVRHETGMITVYPIWGGILNGGNLNKRIKMITLSEDREGRLIERKCKHEENKHFSVENASVCSYPTGLLISGGQINSALLREVKSWQAKYIHDVIFFPMDNVMSMPSPRACHGSVLINNTAFMIGGRMEGTAEVNCVDAFDFNGRQWHHIKPMLEPVLHPLVATVHSKIYVVPSDCKVPSNVDAPTSLTHCSRVQIYDTVRDFWSYGAELPVDLSTYGACMVAYDKFLFLIAGSDRLCLRYCTETNDWTRLVPTPNVQCFGAALLHEHTILLFGGATYTKDIRNSNTDQVLEYHILDNMWTVSQIKTIPASQMYVGKISVPKAYFDTL